MVAQNMKESKKILNAMSAVRTLYACCVRAVNTLQQLVARHRNAIDAIKTLWERLVDAVKTLYKRSVHATNSTFDIFRRISQRPHSALTGFQNAV